MLMHTPYAVNIFHMLNDGVMPAFQTLRELGLLPYSVRRCHLSRCVRVQRVRCPYGALPFLRHARHGHQSKAGMMSNRGLSAEGNSAACLSYDSADGATLIVMSPEVLHQRLTFFLRHLSGEQIALSGMNGVCFKQLVLGSSVLIDMYHRSCVTPCRCQAMLSKSSGRSSGLRRVHCRFGDEILQLRSHALLAFRQYALQSALTHKVTHSVAPRGHHRTCRDALATAEGEALVLHLFKPSLAPDGPTSGTHLPGCLSLSSAGMMG